MKRPVDTIFETLKEKGFKAIVTYPPHATYSDIKSLQIWGNLISSDTVIVQEFKDGSYVIYNKVGHQPLSTQGAREEDIDFINSLG